MTKHAQSRDKRDKTRDKTHAQSRDKTRQHATKHVTKHIRSHATTRQTRQHMTNTHSYSYSLIFTMQPILSSFPTTFNKRDIHHLLYIEEWLSL